MSGVRGLDGAGSGALVDPLCDNYCGIPWRIYSLYRGFCHGVSRGHLSVVYRYLQHILGVKARLVDLHLHEPHKLVLQVITEGLEVLGHNANVAAQVPIGAVEVNHPSVVGSSSADYRALGNVNSGINILDVSVQQKREEELAGVRSHLLLPAAQELYHQGLDAFFESVDKLPDL